MRVLALAVLVLAGCAQSAAACPARGVLAFDPQAVLLLGSGGGGPGGGAGLEGCVRAGARTRALVKGAPLRRFGPVALRGTLAAVAVEQHGVDTSDAEVLVLDVRSGRTLRRAPAVTPSGRPESFASVSALALAEGGDAGWIAVRSGVGQSRRLEVWRLDARGATLLDGSPAVDGASLRLVGRRLRWRDGPAERSAPA